MPTLVGVPRQSSAQSAFLSFLSINSEDFLDSMLVLAEIELILDNVFAFFWLDTHDIQQE